jgi:hypothetical protein
VGLPAAYYLARLRGGGEYWWPLPDPASALHRTLLGLALSLGALTVAVPSWRWKSTLAAALDRRLGPTARIGLGRLTLIVGTGLLLQHWHHARGPVGDIDTWLRLANNPFIQGSEPLGRWSHYLGYRILALFSSTPDNMEALRISSYGAGLFFLYLAIRILPDVVPPEDAATAVMFVVIAPVAILFFGFPANSPWSYSFLGVYLLAGLRYLKLKPNRGPWPETFLIGMAVWAHGMALFATGAEAVLIGVWFFRWSVERGASQIRRWGVAAALVAITFGFLGATLAWAYKFGSGLPESPWYGCANGGIFHRTWILFAGKDAILDFPGQRFEQYVFLSHDYVRGVLNLVLLISPGLVLVPVAAWRLVRSRPREVAFLMAALVGLLVVTLLWNPDNGFDADVKLSSAFTLPAYCLLLLWLVGSLEPRRWKWLAALAASTAFACTLAPYLNFP